MTFKLRSGNKSPFKNMGSSPAKDMKTGKYEHSFESPAKQLWKAAESPAKQEMGGGESHSFSREGYYQSKRDERGESDPRAVAQALRSPAKQRLKKGGEAQDENKIFNKKGEHVGNWVGDKKVMFKMPKVMKDGPKTNVTGIDLGKDPHWQPYRAKKKKSPAKQKPKGFNWTGSEEAKKSKILTPQEKTANFRAEGRKTKTVRSTQVTPSGKVVTKTAPGARFAEGRKNVKLLKEALERVHIEDEIKKSREFMRSVETKRVPTSSASDKVLHKNLNKIADRYRTKKVVSKKAVKNIGKKVLKQVAKRVLGPVSAAIAAYDVAKTIPKVSKATVKGLKKRAKSDNVNIGRKL